MVASGYSSSNEDEKQEAIATEGVRVQKSQQASFLCLSTLSDGPVPRGIGSGAELSAQ